MCRLNAGIARATSSAAAAPPQSDRAAQHARRRPRPRSATRRRAGAQAREERDPAAVDAVAELRQHGRQHGQRADERDRDHQHGAHAERREDLRAHEEHARHRGHHHRSRRSAPRGPTSRRRPGAHRRASARARAPRARGAGRTASSRRRRPGRSSRITELIDSSTRIRWLNSAVSPSAAEHRGDAEQQRDAGGDERAEGEDEDQQRHRQRGHLGLLEVVADALA